MKHIALLLLFIANCLSANAAQLPITVGTAESKASIDTNFVNTQSNFTELYTKVGVANAINVLDAGATTDGTNTTVALQTAINSHDAVYLPAGTYSVDYITIPTGKTILTAGHATVIAQRSGQVAGTRVISITGSNVTIGGCTIIGNITTDSSEQNHGIYIKATPTTGNISQVVIGDVAGENIRGDVIYIGASATGESVKGVSVGNIKGRNIYRNIVAIVGGSDIKLTSIRGTEIGYHHLDIEPDAATVKNIVVGSIVGRTVGISGSSASAYIDAVNISILDLSPSNASQSTPSYAPGVALADGLSLRNIKRLNIGHFTGYGFNRCAIFTIYNSGELGCQVLNIETLNVSNNSVTDTTYNSFINLLNNSTNITNIGAVYADISTSGKILINNMFGGTIKTVNVTASNGSKIFNQLKNVTIDNIAITGDGIFMQGGDTAIINGGSFVGARLAAYSSNCSFRNLTATVSDYVFTSGYEFHEVGNSTLGSVYYGPFGIHLSAAPSAGTYPVGKIVYNISPAAGGTIGWVCTTAGTIFLLR